MVKLPEDLELDINAFENILTMNRMTNSYKLYWFAAIFEEIKKGNRVLNFRDIVLGMIAKSWHTIVRYKLNLGSQDKLANIVNQIHKQYDIENNMTVQELRYFLDNDLKDDSVEDRIKDLYKYVPYRLLSPFYPQIVGMKDYKKNDLIEQLSQKDERAIYRIADHKITVNDSWFKYIFENQIIIEGWLKNKLINFLQYRNPNVPAIPFKLDIAHERELKRAKDYWNKIIDIKHIEDIYSGKSIGRNSSISIDHFIPWSFVLHDKLWNLVPTFKDINSSKSDKLSDLDHHLNKFCQLQADSFKLALNHDLSAKYLEDYLEINKNIRLSKEIPKEYFINSLKETITPIYQIAKNQGFIVWESYSYG